MTKKQVSFLIKILILCLGFIFSDSLKPCFAAFSINVEPYEGGYDIRFGRLAVSDPKKSEQITITITTDIGKQYRVYQRVDQPLRSPDNIEIDPNQFKMYTLLGSNSKGTLERLEEYPVMISDTLLYTSNTAGDGDSFKVVYTLTPSPNQAQNSYYGRIIYILRPIDSTQDQVIKTIYMYAELSNEGAVELSTSTGFKTIVISSSDLDKASFQYPRVLLTVKGNVGARYRLYQRFADSTVRSQIGTDFDLKNVIYEVVDVSTGQITKQEDLRDLRAKSLIYASDDLGTGNQVVITYKPTKDFPQSKAGFYRGSINYYLEIDRPTPSLEPGFIDAVGLELNVEPIFRIVALSLDEEKKPQKEDTMLLRFGQVDYKTGPKESKVRIKVQSNKETPYLVTQKLAQPLQNPQGARIPDEQFTFVLESLDTTQGTLKLQDETVFESARDIVLFVSDAKGSSDEFDITYKLRTTPDTKGGDYTTAVSYSLSEL